jgi:hypothetical protein
MVMPSKGGACTQDIPAAGSLAVDPPEPRNSAAHITPPIRCVGAPGRGGMQSQQPCEKCATHRGGSKAAMARPIS